MSGVRCMLAIENGDCIIVTSRKTGMTYDCAFRTIAELRKMELIRTKKMGGTNLITITEKGHSLKKCLFEIRSVLKK